MLAKQSSGSANGLASWYDPPRDGERGVINARREHGTDPAPESLSSGITAIAKADRPRRAFWSSAVDFFVEGLASCGTSLHPVMFFMEQPALFDLERGNDSRMPAGSVKREREIGKAVAALERLDDRTLFGLGICHRSHIELTVRYCHDC
jgi:hypothetical protein